MTSSRKKSGISAVDQEAGHNAIGFLCDLQKMRADNRTCKKSWNLGDLGVGRESFTMQNVHESVLLSWVKCLM